MRFSHLDEEGKARMVDVGDKPDTLREAVAIAQIKMKPGTLKAILDKKIPKGDVFSVARTAGILAAKRVDELIPLSHPLPLHFAGIDFLVHSGRLHLRSRVKTFSKTGVEMEALTAVALAALTVYDMCKSLEKEIRIGPIQLIYKSGGKSGRFVKRKFQNFLESRFQGKGKSAWL